MKSSNEMAAYKGANCSPRNSALLWSNSAHDTIHPQALDYIFLQLRQTMEELERHLHDIALSTSRLIDDIDQLRITDAETDSEAISTPPSQSIQCPNIVTWTPITILPDLEALGIPTVTAEELDSIFQQRVAELYSSASARMSKTLQDVISGPLFRPARDIGEFSHKLSDAAQHVCDLRARKIKEQYLRDAQARVRGSLFVASDTISGDESDNGSSGNDGHDSDSEEAVNIEASATQR